MIKIDDINPDFEKLRNYFNGGLSLERIPISFVYYRLKDELPGFNESNFETFLRKHELLSSLGDLYIPVLNYRDSWDAYQIDLSSAKPPYDDYLNDVENFKNFISTNEEIKNIEIKISSPTDFVKIESDYFVSNVLNLLKRYTYYRQSEFDALSQINSRHKRFKLREYFPRKDSPYKIFAHSLYDLFRYLRIETHFKDKPQTKSIDFIVDFTEKFIGVDWNIICPKNIPNDYLKDNFKKYKKSKSL